MKTKNVCIYAILIIVLFIIGVSTGCKKDDDKIDKGNGNNGSSLIMGAPCPGIPTFTDSRDGSVYSTVQIGNQCWMAENLKFLPSVVGANTGSENSPHYYVYEYEGTDLNAAKSTTYYQTYGALYNWTAAMNGLPSSEANPSGIQGICPIGWHLPSDAEWTQLIEYLGGTSIAGGKLKATTHWVSPNTGATNETKFTALPGMGRQLLLPHGYGFFAGGGGHFGLWWSATENYSNTALGRHMIYNLSSVSTMIVYKEEGFSIRCVKD